MTSYATRAIARWLDGEYGPEPDVYEASIDLVHATAPGGVAAVAKELEEFLADMLPQDGLVGDLLRGAVSEVDWRELAVHKYEEIIEIWTREARKLGAQHACAAASWIADNTDPGHAQRVLSMLDDGDPAAEQFLPSSPDLSGEYAGGLTPAKLAAEIAEAEVSDSDLIDALASAYEDGVSDAFTDACAAELRVRT